VWNYANLNEQFPKSFSPAQDDSFLGDALLALVMRFPGVVREAARKATAGPSAPLRCAQDDSFSVMN